MDQGVFTAAFGGSCSEPKHVRAFQRLKALHIGGCRTVRIGLLCIRRIWPLPFIINGSSFHDDVGWTTSISPNEMNPYIPEMGL